MIPNTDAQPTDSLYDRMLRRLVKLEEVVELKIEQAPTAREKELEERVKHLERSLREMANRVRDVEDHDATRRYEVFRHTLEHHFESDGPLEWMVRDESSK
jgi:hypothetical protein